MGLRGAVLGADQAGRTLDVLAHRGVWTLPAVLIVLLVAGRFRSTMKLAGDFNTLKYTALAAALISVNWGVFLFAVTNGRATEASLGYFMLPILTAMAGVVVFRKPRPGRNGWPWHWRCWQWLYSWWQWGPCR